MKVHWGDEAVELPLKMQMGLVMAFVATAILWCS